MIVYDLDCSRGHRFEGWFGSSADYAQQFSKGQLVCPLCGDPQINKAPMSPAVAPKSTQSAAQASAYAAMHEAQQRERAESTSVELAPNGAASATNSAASSAGESVAQVSGPLGPLVGGAIPEPVRAAMDALAAAQAEAIKQSKWVGDDFAEKSRAMHYGDAELEAIHGKATLKEAKELLEEGVPLAPLLCPVVEPDKLN